jgi:tRNA uridine 5-carboxymethylaminomethyl modification enzyme
MMQGHVFDLLFDSDCKRVLGVKLEDGSELKAHSVVIATGTFLGGEIHIGLESRAAGRMGEAASIGLSHSLKHVAKLELGRMRTGTPPRLLAKSINFQGLLAQPSDSPAQPFSFLNAQVQNEVSKIKSGMEM